MGNRIVASLFLLISAVTPASAQQIEVRGPEGDGGVRPLVTVMDIIDFRNPESTRWAIVNDGVMGGRSSSTIEPAGPATASFNGFVSLENNGGFASVRALFNDLDLTGYDGLQLRVRGDGRSYELRLRTSGNMDGIAYRARFSTQSNEWQDVFVPFSAFQPSFRGWVPRGAGPLDLSSIRQVGFLIGDKRQGPFELEIAWVRAISVAE